MTNDDAAPPGERNLARLVDHLRATRPGLLEATENLKARYFRTKRDDIVREALEEALTSLATRRPNARRHEGHGVAIIGHSGSGKSRLTDQMIGTHPLFQGFGQPDSDCPALSVQCPGSSTLGVLAIEILRRSG